MANEGHSHGPQIGCQWWGPWRLAISCHVGPTCLPLPMPIWARMGPMYVCHQPTSNIPWASWGASVCVSRNTHITGDRKGHPNKSAVARSGKYAANGSFKLIVFMPRKSHPKQVSCETRKMARRQGYVFVTKLSPHMCIYIVIGVLALYVVHIDWPIKLSMLSHCLITHWPYIVLIFFETWNGPWKAVVLPHIGTTWALHSSANETAHVNPVSCQTSELHRIPSVRPMKLRIKIHRFSTHEIHIGRPIILPT